jgi:hypothetical protein
MHFVFVAVAQLWDMRVLVLISKACGGSPLVVGLAGILTTIFVQAYVPTNGSLHSENLSRLDAIRYTIFFKFLVAIGAYATLTYLDTEGFATQFMKPDAPLFASTLAWGLAFLQALASVLFSNIHNALEKDWLDVISADDEKWLAEAKATLSKIVLVISTGGPVLLGLLCDNFGSEYVSRALLGSLFIVLVVLYVFVGKVCNDFPALQDYVPPEPAPGTAGAPKPIVSTGYKALDAIETQVEEEVEEVEKTCCLWLKELKDAIWQTLHDTGAIMHILTYLVLFATVLKK